MLLGTMMDGGDDAADTSLTDVLPVYMSGAAAGTERVPASGGAAQ